MGDEIRPPVWAVRDARRLTLAEFGAEFDYHSRRVRSRILKSETWQTYQEPDTESLRAYLDGNLGGLERLLEAEADADRDVYERVRRNGTPFIRLRAVKMPLVPYLAYEMWNYVVRARRAETIEIADLSDDHRPLPNHSYFDFLLFDERAALIHDYGRDGLQVGGWLASDPAVLSQLGLAAAEIRSRSVPLEAFLTTHGLRTRYRGRSVVAGERPMRS
jgi:hypothetical protein